MKITKRRLFAAAARAIAGFAAVAQVQAQPAKEDAIIIRTETQPIAVTVEAFPQPAVQCLASVGLQYTQRNNVVMVDAEIENASCGASQGSYGLTVSVRDANGERQVLEFEETWQRADAQNVVFTKEYPLGEDVDLLTVRARSSRCSCDEPTTAE